VKASETVTQYDYLEDVEGLVPDWVGDWMEGLERRGTAMTGQSATRALARAWAA